MLDYKDLRATVPPNLILRNPNILWDDAIVDNRTTGEVIKYWGKLGHLTVAYALKTNRLKVDGSLQKYEQDGRNTGDFTRSEALTAIARLCDQLHLLPDQLTVATLEFGVNVVPPVNSTAIINRAHLCRAGQLRPFDNLDLRTKGYGKKTRNNPGCRKPRYRVKIYDKGTQGNLRWPLLRLELHTQGYTLRKRLQRDRLTLQSLTGPEVWHYCSDWLLDTVADGIVWREPVDTGRMKAREREFYYHAGQDAYWEQPMSRSTRAGRLQRFIDIGAKYRTDAHTSTVTAAVRQKIIELTQAAPKSVRIGNPQVNRAGVSTSPSVQTISVPFAKVVAHYLKRSSVLTPQEQQRHAAGLCIECGRPLPLDRRPDMQTCPRSVRQCRNIRSNRAHDRLKPARRQYDLARAGQGLLFPLTVGLAPPAA